MSKLTKIKYSIIVMVFVTLMGLSPVAIIADTAPIVPIGDIDDKFTPSTYDDWDYYILPPDTAFSGVIYGGGSGTTSDTRYTDVQTNDFTHFGSSLTRGGSPSSNLLQSDFRPTSHDFFNDTPYPRAVRTVSEKNPEYVQTQKTAISLHNDHSTTFFAEGWEGYGGYFNTTEPFFIDVEVSSKKVLGAIMFDSVFPEAGYTFGNPERKMTYPVIPRAPGLQQFMLVTNDSTLVTLTPHEWKFPTWFPSLDINTIFSEEFDQGEPWFKDETNDQLIQPDNEMFSLRMFNLSVEEDTYYRINTAFEMDEVRPGVPGTPPLTSLLGNSFEVISGALDQEGLLIKAIETVEVTLIMYSPGEAHGSYSIFYQEMPPIPIAETAPLTFNVDLALEYELLYTFTLSTPILIRVNATGAFDYDIYIAGTEPGDWIKKSDENFIGGTYRYLPAGTYAVEIVSYTVGDEIRFNSVPIRSSSAIPFSVSEETILAVELPLTKNRINFVNLSTVDHVNQSIDYSWSIISKYNELVSSASGTITLGNLQTNGVWDASPTNESKIREYLPTREREAPILLIYPTGADNFNNVSDPMTFFGGSLTVSVDEAPDQSFEPKTFYTAFNAFSGSNFIGTFVPKSTITSTTSYSINSEVTTDNDQVLGIPLNLDPYSIYNVTLTLTGNYSTTSSLNVTFQNNYRYRVMGGDLRDLRIFGTFTSGSDNTHTWQSTLIQTVSEISYLYFDLQRNGAAPYYNGTLHVSILNIGANNMEFHLEQEYNETVGDYEVKSTSLLVKEIKPSEMKKATPGFDLSLVFIALVISSIFASKKRRNR
jgi:hypothetical protein